MKWDSCLYWELGAKSLVVFTYQNTFIQYFGGFETVGLLLCWSPPCPARVAVIQRLCKLDAVISSHSNQGFHFNLSVHVFHFVSHWSGTKGVWAEIDLKADNCWLILACEGMRPRAEQRGVSPSPGARAEVDAIDLDPAHSLTHPLFSSSFFFSLCLLSWLPLTRCRSPLAVAREPQSAGESWLSAACGGLCQGSSKCPGEQPSFSVLSVGCLELHLDCEF